MIDRILLLAGALLVFGTVNWRISGKEQLRASGEVVFLELAPVDPRSLLQGDYMALDFVLARDIRRVIRDANPPQPPPPAVILKTDARGVASFARLDHGGSLNPGERRLKFRLRNGGVWLGTNGFFFHEGDAQRYRGARFGEFRVTAMGDAMLVDLRDSNLANMPPAPTAIHRP